MPPIPSPDDFQRVIAAYPQAVVPFTAVLAEFAIIFAARRTLSGLSHVLTVAEITAFTAAVTVLSAGALAGTFLTTKLPYATGSASLVGYIAVLPILVASEKIRASAAGEISRLEYAGRYTLGALLLAVAVAYFWLSLVLAAVYPEQ